MSSKDTPVPTVAALNAQGIDFLKVGDHRNATTKLQEALNIVRSKLEEESDAPLSSAAAASGDNLPRAQSRICVPVGVRAYFAVYSSPMDEDEEGCTDRAGSVFRCFDRAFVLPAGAGESRTSCVILYNLGLCHTLAWLETREASDLYMAIKLYKMAMAVAESCMAEAENVSDNAIMDDYVLLQLLALFNNLGYLQHYEAQIYRRGTSTPEEQAALTLHCVRAIRALIATRYPAPTNNVGSSSQEAQQSPQSQLHDEDFLFFRWSVLFLFQQQDKAIAAAA